MTDLTAIRALLASVQGFTPGPWRRDGFDVVPARLPSEGWQVADCGTSNSPDSAPYNADLIAAAPTLHAHLTDLADEVERLRANADNVWHALDAAGVRDDVDDRYMQQVSEHSYEPAGEHRQAYPDERVGFLASEVIGLRSEVERLRAHNARMAAALTSLAVDADGWRHAANQHGDKLPNIDTLMLAIGVQDGDHDDYIAGLVADTLRALAAGEAEKTGFELRVEEEAASMEDRYWHYGEAVAAGEVDDV